MAILAKGRYWLAVCYPENMRSDWEDVVGDILGIPYAYGKHDKDMLAKYKSAEPDEQERQRKEHVHFLLAYSNTTTYSAVLNLINKLSVDGKKCCNKVEQSMSVRNSYEYLIHNTETCKKLGKYLYDPSARITGNNFDIGAYEQISAKEKNDMVKELCNIIVEKQFSNFIDFYIYISENFDSQYFDILKTHNGLFERMTKGNYQKKMSEMRTIVRMKKDD